MGSGVTTAIDTGDGDGDTGETGGSCDQLDCGFGTGIINPDASTVDTVPCICDCDVGYISLVEGGECVLDTDCFNIRPVECRTSNDEGSGVGMLFSLEYCSGHP